MTQNLALIHDLFIFNGEQVKTLHQKISFLWCSDKAFKLFISATAQRLHFTDFYVIVLGVECLAWQHFSNNWWRRGGCYSTTHNCWLHKSKWEEKCYKIINQGRELKRESWDDLCASRNHSFTLMTQPFWSRITSFSDVEVEHGDSMETFSITALEFKFQ